MPSHHFVAGNIPYLFWAWFAVMLLLQSRCIQLLTSPLRARFFLPWVYGFLLRLNLCSSVCGSAARPHLIARNLLRVGERIQSVRGGAFWSLMAEKRSHARAGVGACFVLHLGVRQHRRAPGPRIDRQSSK